LGGGENGQSCQKDFGSAESPINKNGFTKELGSVEQGQDLWAHNWGLLQKVKKGGEPERKNSVCR